MTSITSVAQWSTRRNQVIFAILDVSLTVIKLLRFFVLILLPVYKALVRLHVEYANSVWSPYRKGDIEATEKIQKRATKLVISLRKLPSKERLQHLNLYTLKYRTLRGGYDRGLQNFASCHQAPGRAVATGREVRESGRE